MKATHSLIAFSILAVMILPPAVCANPKNGQVKAGAASFEEGASALTIRQSSDRGIIHWQDFSIGHGEITKFIQPGANSATLNRVVGGNASSLLGALQANGKIFVINPNGILIGAGARIDTGSFVASTLDVSDAEFLAGGDMKFVGPSTGAVTNLGTINASSGDIFLIAREVNNAGTLNAPNGVVGLGAGSEVLLKAAGDERLFVSAGSGGAVTNSGTIAAAQAELKAGGGSPYGLAVNNTGVIRATGVVNKNGRVLLTAGGGTVKNSGTIFAKNAGGSGGYVRMDSGKGGKTINSGTIDASGSAGQRGGTAELFGTEVTLASNSLIDASGGAGGGTVNVGGTISDKATVEGTPASEAASAESSDRTHEKALRTNIEIGSRILANAVDVGDGGKIFIWSEQLTNIDGVMEAKGGAHGGNGGLIETSGKLVLNVFANTKISASAAAGKAGTWLLDPYNLSIVAGLGLVNNSGPFAFTATGPGSQVGADLIKAQLDGGTNVTLSTAGAGAEAGDIMILADITKDVAGAATLQFDADGTITLGANIGGTAFGDLNVIMNAVGNITSTAAFGIAANSLTLNSTGGDVTLSGPVVVTNLAATVGFFAGVTGVTINNSANQIGTITGITSGHGVNIFDSAGGLIISGNVSGGGIAPGDTFHTILQTTGDLTINPGVTIFSNVNGDIFLEASGGFFINNSGPGALGSSSGWAVYSQSNAFPFNAGGLVATQPAGAYVPPLVGVADIAFKGFFFAVGGGGGGGGGGAAVPVTVGETVSDSRTGGRAETSLILALEEALNSGQTPSQITNKSYGFQKESRIEAFGNWYDPVVQAFNSAMSAIGGFFDGIARGAKSMVTNVIKAATNNGKGWVAIPQNGYNNVAAGTWLAYGDNVKFATSDGRTITAPRGGGFYSGGNGWVGMADANGNQVPVGSHYETTGGFWPWQKTTKLVYDYWVKPGSGAITATGTANVLMPPTGNFAAGGGRLIGQDGAGVLSHNGNALIGQDGAGLIGQDGAGLIGQDGAGLIGQDGAGISFTQP